jgi:hypothetical protein
MSRGHCRIQARASTSVSVRLVEYASCASAPFLTFGRRVGSRAAQQWVPIVPGLEACRPTPHSNGVHSMQMEAPNQSFKASKLGADDDRHLALPLDLFSPFVREKKVVERNTTFQSPDKESKPSVRPLCHYHAWLHGRARSHHWGSHVFPKDGWEGCMSCCILAFYCRSPLLPESVHPLAQLFTNVQSCFHWASTEHTECHLSRTGSLNGRTKVVARDESASSEREGGRTSQPSGRPIQHINTTCT